MRQVDPVAYSGVDRAERRRLASTLADLRAAREQALQTASQLKGKGMAAAGAAKTDAETLAAQQIIDMARALEAANAVPPIEMWACAGCHRPTSTCVCTDADGNPLDWDTLS